MSSYNWPVITASVATTPAPIQFVLDGVDTDVEEVSGTPANSRPLPTKVLDSAGAEVDFATEAKQDTQITALNAANASLDAIEAIDFATEAKQDTIITALGAANTSLDNIEAVDFATEAKQDTGNASLSSIDGKTPSLGQAAMAASVPVVIASNQSALLPSADVTASGTTTNSGDAVTLACAGLSSVGFQTAGTWSATHIPEGTQDGLTWTPVYVFVRGTNAAAAQSVTTNNFFFCSVAGLTSFRLRRSTAGSGTATITLTGSSATSVLITHNPNSNNFLVAASQTGNWTTRLNDGAGTSVTLGQKAMSASLPVTFASDQSALPISGSVTATPTYLTCIDKARLDFSTSNVTTSAYVQLDASLAANCKEIEIYNSSSEPLLLATGAAASEVDQMYIMPGGNGRVPFVASSAVRTSLKAVSATINSGQILVNFYG